MVLPSFLSVTLGLIVYFLGAFFTRKIAFLRNYNIPEPVSGSIAVALGTWVIFRWTGTEITFDLSIRDYLLVLFFSTIGLNAQIQDLYRNGKALLVLLLLTVVFIVVQNVVALIGVTAFGLPRASAVMLGSASLIGGHGTSIAWGPRVSEITGMDSIDELGIAAATLGLVLATLVGGPIAKFLIERNGLEGDHETVPTVGLEYEEPGEPHEQIDHVSLMRALLVSHVVILFGYILHGLLARAGLDLPLFVPCLLMGIVLSNTVPVALPRLPWPARTRALAITSDYSLSLFLAMSLMSMQFWTLQGVGGPLIAVLAVQVAVAAVFILFVFFPLMGRSYTAAVLSAGFAGFTLGATPTAIANMSSVTKSYGAAPLAFILLPLVSAFFVDLANAVVIQFFVSL
ncbi:sodium/glutamate symporter [Pseudoruegeria sp. HB172150]|uniref:sodium/glutamate symporter n=1 Tax=Pseudoruegeria sp. HB172150 TaxID=2721164 RepID=UPI0015554FB4|nr:sodium/glutamate symporter [Pseudoruegeria sp. HB172150]